MDEKELLKEKFKSAISSAVKVRMGASQRVKDSAMIYKAVCADLRPDESAGIV